MYENGRVVKDGKKKIYKGNEGNDAERPKVVQKMKCNVHV